jgi:hypothetical protein
MAITYISNNAARMALVVIYQGIGKKGIPEFEQVEEPIVGWQIQDDVNESIITPVIGGYQRHDLGTTRIAIFDYSGTITWNGRQFENLDQFMNDFRTFALSEESQSPNKSLPIKNHRSTYSCSE